MKLAAQRPAFVPPSGGISCAAMPRFHTPTGRISYMACPCNSLRPVGPTDYRCMSCGTAVLALLTKHHTYGITKQCSRGGMNSLRPLHQSRAGAVKQSLRATLRFRTAVRWYFMRGDAALSYAYRADFIHGLCPGNFIACHGKACMRRRIPADYVQKTC